MFNFWGKRWFMLDVNKGCVKTVKKVPRNARLIANGKDRELRARMLSEGVSELTSLCFEVEAVATWFLAAHQQRVRQKSKVPTPATESVTPINLGSTNSMPAT